jgi:hypothetical protein
MTDAVHAEAQSEATAVIRWIILFPTFATLVLLSANFTLGFFQWLEQLDGWLFYLMLPVALMIVLSNILPSIIAGMVAPRKLAATVLLGVGHVAGMMYGYSQFEWAAITGLVFILHGIMVYLGLAAVYYLDRLHEQETEANRP